MWVMSICYKNVNLSLCENICYLFWNNSNLRKLEYNSRGIPLIDLMSHSAKTILYIVEYNILNIQYDF